MLKVNITCIVFKVLAKKDLWNIMSDVISILLEKNWAMEMSNCIPHTQQPGNMQKEPVENIIMNILNTI